MSTRQDGVIPDFLRMDDAIGSDPANADKTGNWQGWPTKDLNPVKLQSICTLLLQIWEQALLCMGGDPKIFV